MTVVLVPDTLRGLHAVAAAWRRRFSPLVVGVTGSIAKTSTKEAVAGVLERRFATLRTEGNRNNEVGMPLTVLDLGPAHEAAVLEMGMYTGGEIRELAAIGRPSIGIVTAVQPVHLSRHRVARRDRGREGRARRGAARRRRRRRRDPQRRRPAGPRGWPRARARA